MNRQQRRAAGHDLRCVDCGRNQVASKAGDGWLCLPCLGKRNDFLGGLAAAGQVVMQPVDPDGPPVRCGMTGCRRDAVTVLRVASRGVLGCAEHTAAASKAAVRIAGGSL